MARGSEKRAKGWRGCVGTSFEKLTKWGTRGAVLGMLVLGGALVGLTMALGG